MTGEQFEKLGRRVALEQEAMLEAEPVTGLRERVLSAPLLPKRRARLPRALLAAAALVVILGFAIWQRQARLQAHVGAEALSSGAWIAAGTDRPVSLDFSDGSALTFAPGTRGRLGRLEQSGAEVMVEAGHVEARVVHRSSTKYRLSFGPFAVDVTGTRFDVNWDPSEELLTLTLREGSVLVSGCVLGSGRPLLAGETLRAWCKDKRFEVRASEQQAALSDPPALAPAPTVSAEPAPRPSRASAAGAAVEVAPSSEAAAPSWQKLARDGLYGEAYAAARARDFSAECEQASLADLTLLADVARFSKSSQAAIQAYTTLRRRFPGKGAQAAFSIARLHFDQLGQYDEAARWFRTYLSEQPRGALAREALGRLMESEQRAGHAAQAESTAREYLKRYPQGPHARLATRLRDEH